MQVKLKQILTLLLFLAVIIFINSCDKPDDLSKINTDYQYQGSLALPVGNSKLTLQYNSTIDTSWLIFPDSILPKTITIPLDDTIPFDFASIGEFNKIKGITLFIHLSNYYPMVDTFQLFLADSNKVVTQNIAPKKIIISSATFKDNDTVPSVPAQKILDRIIFNRDSRNNWTDVKYFIINGTLTNDLSHKNLFKYFKNYYLQVYIVLQVDFDFNTKDIK
jgi:hypothetical protein